MDYYKVLGIASNASRKEIKAAYRMLALRLHPDINHNNDPSKRQEFARVNEAYETLNDVDKRKSYDKLIGLNKVLKRDRPKNNYNGYSHDPYAPRKEVDPKHFNASLWNAWHYGDNAIIKPSVTQLNNFMHLKDSKDQAYFRKKMNSNRLNINIDEYNITVNLRRIYPEYNEQLGMLSCMSTVIKKNENLQYYLKKMSRKPLEENLLNNYHLKPCITSLLNMKVPSFIDETKIVRDVCDIKYYKETIIIMPEDTDEKYIRAVYLH